MHDPAEKKDAKKSTVWVTIDVSRADLALSPDEFAERYGKPAFQQLAHFFALHAPPKQ